MMRRHIFPTFVAVMRSVGTVSSFSARTSPMKGPAGAHGTLVGTGTLGGTARGGELRKLYPPIEPHRTDFLEVGSVHRVYYEECGNPAGKPVVFVHGGPGGGCTAANRCFFDPEKYRIILMDQRGAGRSRPAADLTDNTTWHLIRDLEMLREELDIDRWMLFGGSWGSTLSLCYAIEHPERVTELVLRGIFLLKREELDFFYQSGTSFVFPDAFEEYAGHIPEEERGELLKAYHRRLTSEDQATREAAAKRWTTWEMATSFASPNPEYIAKGDDPAFAAAFARIETHYFVHGAWLPTPDHILDNVDKIRHIPTFITHGRYDMVCCFKSGFDLSRRFPEAEFVVCGKSGHSANEVEHTSELVMACDRFARTVPEASEG